MKACLLIITLFVGSAIANTKLYIVKGNVVNYHTPKFNLALKELVDFSKQDHLNVDTEVFFNRHWWDICNQIEKDKDHFDYDNIIMISHSWGVSASFSVANCLERSLGRTTDLIITVDPVVKPFSNTRYVPSSVRNVISYYQKRDMFLRGISSMKASSPETSLEQRQILLNSRFNAHDEIFKVLVENDTLQNHILDHI